MNLSKRLLAEFLGTMGLLTVIVGSGIMGEELSSGNTAIALLANSIATGAGLYSLIQTFGPISGAHFNPFVSFAEFFWKRLNFGEFAAYSLTQITGGLAGVFIAHLIFGRSLIQISTHDRLEWRFIASEIVATFGLLLVIALSGKKNVNSTPAAVALYITSAYWFTSSTAFANPAVTIARSFTNTFSGIHWAGTPWFIVAQFVGMILAIWVAGRFV